jgi:DNA polymerase IV
MRGPHCGHTSMTREGLPVKPDTAPPSARLSRWVLHLDLDAFFASVEELLDPSLAGKPLIVAGRPEQRGVVASASYPARAFGVRSAMPTSRALRLCPKAILVPPRHGVYGQYSKQVMAILAEYTPLLEQVSIDEAFLDITGCDVRWGPAPELANAIRQRVLDQTHLSASIGLASNKLVAKVASDLKKPFGLVVVPHGTEAAFLAPLKVERLWGVGKVTGAALHSLGVETIGDLAALSAATLLREFGPHGAEFRDRALGIDETPVVPEWEAKSMSREETFSTDIVDERRIEREILRLSESVAASLRKAERLGRTVHLKLRYHDFTTVLRSASLGSPFDSADAIHPIALELFRKTWDRGRPVRLVGVGVTNLSAPSERQLSLFDTTEDERRRTLDRALDQIRLRFGSKSIQRASLMKRDDPEARAGQAPGEGAQSEEEGHR